MVIGMLWALVGYLSAKYYPDFRKVANDTKKYVDLEFKRTSVITIIYQ